MQQYARGAVVWRKRRKAWSLAIVAHGVAPHRSTSESDVDGASFTVSCAFLTGYPTPPPAVAPATPVAASPPAASPGGGCRRSPPCPPHQAGPAAVTGKEVTGSGSPSSSRSPAAAWRRPSTSWAHSSQRG